MIHVAGANGAANRGRLLPMLVVGNGIIGGMEEYVLSLARHFRELNQRTLVAAPFVGEFTAALLEQGHPARDLYIFDMSDQINVGALAQLAMFLRARKVSLVHTHLLPADLLGAAAAAHAGIPAISTLHGLIRFKEELLLRDLYGLRYVAVSEAGRASAIACGLPPDAVGKIPNGVDPQVFNPGHFNRAQLRERLGVAEEEMLVTCVSRLSREKYPEGFIKAAEIAATSDPHLVFALVGTGPLDSQIRQMVAVSRSRGRIRLLGARRDIAEILAASDIAALTSRSESLPFSILEAMAMELPVVAHDVGGVAEALEEGVEGFLVPFGRTRTFAARMLKLTADSELRRRMGRAGRAKVLGTFDFRKTAQALLELYAEVAQTKAEAAVVGLRASRRAGAPAPPLFGASRRDVAGASAGAPPSLGAPRHNGAGASAVALSSSTLPARRGTESVVPASPLLVDVHLHLSGGETCEQVLCTLDEAGIGKACLIAPFLNTRSWLPSSGAVLRRANESLLDIVAQAPERLWGLVSIDPREGSAALRQLEAYAATPGVCGLKLIPHGWTPEEKAALAAYEVCEDQDLPILFHSGVFISGRATDACRPARYEAVRRFPGLRVVLAHLGWPWVDEAIAVAFMDVLKGAPPQILLDTSPGTPPIYRDEALRKAFAVVGPGALLWGSDRFLPLDGKALREQLDQDLASFRSLGTDAGALEKIFGGNAAALFAPRLRSSSIAGVLAEDHEGNRCSTLLYVGGGDECGKS
jgi:glycosyltransferase involved in cell wall biosynthesis/predicted TIM-barrel fold metal-dependent hydrolase